MGGGKPRKTALRDVSESRTEQVTFQQHVRSITLLTKFLDASNLQVHICFTRKPV